MEDKFISLFSAFAKAPSVGSLFSLIVSRHDVAIEHGVAYGDHPRRRLDIYRPPGGTAVSAVILFFYGGGWDSGARQMYGFAGTALAVRGYLMLVADYRLFPEVRYPGFMEDAALAARWAATQFRAEIEGGAPFILMGHSAGAHMAALLAYDRSYLEAPDGPRIRPDGLIGISGPYAFDPKTNDRTRDIFATATNADQVRPVAHVKKGAPPALLVHGKEDRIVLTMNALRLEDALDRAGAQAEAVIYEKARHIGLVLALSRPFQHRYNVLTLIDHFIAGLKDG